MHEHTTFSPFLLQIWAHPPFELVLFLSSIVMSHGWSKIIPDIKHNYKHYCFSYKFWYLDITSLHWLQTQLHHLPTFSEISPSIKPGHESQSPHWASADQTHCVEFERQSTLQAAHVFSIEHHSSHLFLASNASSMFLAVKAFFLLIIWYEISLVGLNWFSNTPVRSISLYKSLIIQILPFPERSISRHESIYIQEILKALNNTSDITQIYIFLRYLFSHSPPPGMVWCHLTLRYKELRHIARGFSFWPFPFHLYHMRIRRFAIRPMHNQLQNQARVDLQLVCVYTMLYLSEKCWAIYYSKILPGHSSGLQDSSRFTIPGQCSGSSSWWLSSVLLDFFRVPPPHDFEHTPTSHALHSQCTRYRCHEIYAFRYCMLAFIWSFCCF